MPQYFFDIVADGELVPDEEGMNLPGLDAARREASHSLGDLARDTARPDRLAISVRTSDGPVFETAFRWDLETKY
jgi:hypothetical protein